MPTLHADIFRSLCAEFDGREVKQFSKAGRNFNYVTARTVMNRLDDVIGPENWWDDYVPGERSVMCRLAIRLPDGEIVTKTDAGGYAGMSDEGDDDKSGFTDAFKRAAAKFGVGRYLYKDGVPRFAAADAQAPPSRPTPTAPQAAPRVVEPEKKPPDFSRPPAGTGQVFGFFKSLRDHYGRDIIKMVDDLARAEEIAPVYKEWDQATVDRLAWRAVQYCKKIPGYKGELDHIEEPTVDPVRSARGALEQVAAAVWSERYPGQRVTPGDIDQVIREFSDGEIAELYQCQDPEAMRRIAQQLGKLVPTRKP